MNEVARLEKNWFEEYGERAAQRNIIGKLLKFSKGDYVVGDDEDVPMGTELVANLDELMIGWVKWVDNRPEDTVMGKVAEGYKPEKRSDLGDTDPANWAIDAISGQPRDPYQFTNYLLLKVPEAAAIDANLFTLATSSRGGIQAIGNLAKAYGQYLRQDPTVYPVVSLGVDSYNHPNKAFGRIKVPLLTIVRWEPKTMFVETLPKKKAVGKK